jgi:cell division protein FtsB
MRTLLAAQEVHLATFRRHFHKSSQEVKNLAASVANLRTQIERLKDGGENSVIPSVGSVPSLEQEYVRLKRKF